MATNKTVTVTVLPTLTGDTVASYNVYEGVSGTTLLGTMSVAEAAAGKVFAFTDGIVHSVKTQTVWTTAGASAIRSAGVELDLSVTATYGLSTAAAQNEYTSIELVAVDPVMEISYQATETLGTVAGVFWGNGRTAASQAGAIQLKKVSTSQAQLRFRTLGGVDTSFAAFTIAAGDTILVKITGAAVECYKNGILEESLADGFVFGGTLLTLNAYSSTLSHISYKCAAFSVKIGANANEIFYPTTQASGNTITGSEGHVMTLNSDDTDTNSMYYTI